MYDVLLQNAPDYPIDEVIEAADAFLQLWESKDYAQIEEVRQLSSQMRQVSAALDTFRTVPIKAFLQARHGLDEQFTSTGNELMSTIYSNEVDRIVKALSNRVLDGTFHTNDMVDCLKQTATDCIQKDYLDKPEYAGWVIGSVSSAYASKSLIEGSDIMNCGATFTFALRQGLDDSNIQYVKIRVEGEYGVDANGDQYYKPTKQEYQ